jgi:hypothetical protein
MAVLSTVGHHCSAASVNRKLASRISDPSELLNWVAAQFFGRIGQRLRDALRSLGREPAEDLAEHILQHWCEARADDCSIRACQASGSADRPRRTP